MPREFDPIDLDSLPWQARTSLVRCALFDRSRVEVVPDAMLLAIPGFGPRSLAAVRAIAPYRPPVSGTDKLDQQNVIHFMWQYYNFRPLAPLSPLSSPSDRASASSFFTK